LRRRTGHPDELNIQTKETIEAAKKLVWNNIEYDYENIKRNRNAFWGLQKSARNINAIQAEAGSFGTYRSQYCFIEKKPANSQYLRATGGSPGADRLPQIFLFSTNI